MMEWKATAKGVWICWDEEEVCVERRDAGTVHDRTEVVGRDVKTIRALWSKDVNASTIEAAERYINAVINNQYINLRVEAREQDL